jgi:hypothetical protein
MISDRELPVNRFVSVPREFGFFFSHFWRTFAEFLSTSLFGGP